MSIDWTPLSRLIAGHDRFLVTSHVRPDGDALGSEVGMAGLLESFGKDVRVVNVSPTPARYDFLAPSPGFFGHFGQTVGPQDLADREVLVILDLSSWPQLGDMAGWVREFPGPRVVIDHHVSEDDLGAVVLKDTRAEATGTLILRAARALGRPVSAAMATGLLTAIAMDTGWFRHSNTSPGTLRDAAELIEAGASIDAIFQKLFERNTLGRVRLLGLVLSRLEVEVGGRLAFAAVRREDFEGTGAVPPETEDIIGHLASIEGVEVAVLFIEQFRGGVKMSMRSRNGLDCARIASRFGGGGHRAAAGANLPEPLSESMSAALEAVRGELAGAPAR